MTVIGDSQQPTLEILRDVILTEWAGRGMTTFHIRQFRNELEAHYTTAGIAVPPAVGNSTQLVPTRRLLEARADLVKPVGMAAIEWQFVETSTNEPRPSMSQAKSDTSHATGIA